MPRYGEATQAKLRLRQVIERQAMPCFRLSPELAIAHAIGGARRVAAMKVALRLRVREVLIVVVLVVLVLLVV